MAKQIRMSASEAQEKHARNLKNSLTDIERGVRNVTESPTAKAATKIDKMRANFNAAIDSGKTAARMRAVTAEDWKAKFLAKGLNRISDGIDAAKDKTISFFEQLFSYEQNLLNQIDGMNDLTPTDAEARMLAWSRGMRKFAKK